MKFHQSSLLNQFSNITSLFTSKKSGNLAFHVGDVKENVVKNHKLLANELGYSYQRVVHMKQIHSSDVLKVNDSYDFYNPPTCDALITNQKNTPLMVMVADCAPILFYDPVQNAIAVAHAGRAGAFLNIVAETIRALTDTYGSNATDIVVSAGAMIQQCCYEVGEEIFQQSAQLGLEYSLECREESYYLDISAIIKSQLLNAGIQEESIEITSECTCCLKEKYFSYRGEQKTGRFAGVICLH